LVVGDDAACVADHVSFAWAQAEKCGHVEPRIHARDDRDAHGRPERARTAELSGVPGVVAEQVVGSAHPTSMVWRLLVLAVRSGRDANRIVTYQVARKRKARASMAAKAEVTATTPATSNRRPRKSNCQRTMAG